MDEYIKKDDVLKVIKDIEMLYGKGSNDDEIISCISSFRGADVAERKQGKWKKVYYGNHPNRCSECHQKNNYRTNFCPNCGADMR